MSPLEIAELVCVIVSMVCGIGQFIIWCVFPNHDAGSDLKGVTVLKMIVSVLFLIATFTEFVLQLIGLGGGR